MLAGTLCTCVHIAAEHTVSLDRIACVSYGAIVRCDLRDGNLYVFCAVFGASSISVVSTVA
jgi:hypothetical protein